MSYTWIRWIHSNGCQLFGPSLLRFCGLSLGNLSTTVWMSDARIRPQPTNIIHNNTYIVYTIVYYIIKWCVSSCERHKVLAKGIIIILYNKPISFQQFKMHRLRSGGVGHGYNLLYCADDFEFGNSIDYEHISRLSSDVFVLSVEPL